MGTHVKSLTKSFNLGTVSTSGDEVSLDDLSPLGIKTSSTSGTIEFQAKIGASYYNISGASITLSTDVTGYIPIDYTKFFGIKNIKIKTADDSISSVILIIGEV